MSLTLRRYQRPDHPEVLRLHVRALEAVGARAENAAEIARMRVDPAHWRRGYGEEILLRLESAAAAFGYTELWLDTLSIQEAAQNLYRKHGYQEVRRIHLRGYQSHEAILFRKLR